MRTTSKGGKAQAFAPATSSKAATLNGVRRNRALNDLAARARSAKTPEQACALFYLVEAEGRTAKLAAASGVPDGHDGALPVLALDGRTFWRFADVRAGMCPVTITHLGTVLADVPPGSRTEPPHTAVVLPITSTPRRQLGGFLVAGVSPRTRLDAQCHGFLDNLAAQVSAAIDNAR